MPFIELKDSPLTLKDRPSLNRNIKSTQFDTIRQALVIRSLLELYLLLKVATLFLLNGLFIILPSVNV